MKTYRNEKYGFAFKVPDEWALPKGEARQLPQGELFAFDCNNNEFFSLIIAPLPSSHSTELIKRELKQFAIKRAYTKLEFGKINVENEDHTWVRYYVGYGRWGKKYKLTSFETEYMITASCIDNSPDQRLFLQREEVWDAIVASFRLDKRYKKNKPKPDSEKEEIEEFPENEFNTGKSQNVKRQQSGKAKTYRNEELGFEIDIPEDWSIPAGGGLDGIDCLPDEAIHFTISPQLPELLPDYIEREFMQYAQGKEYTKLEFGRISAGGKEHVWARYQEGIVEWTKKYMLAFGGVQYVITATGANLASFIRREKIWDAMVSSFRLCERLEREVLELKEHREETAGHLYARAYEAVSEERYTEARELLEQCLSDEPDHILAHKELAVVLKKMGDIKSALSHRREVKRLDPSDTVNRFNLADLLASLGEREDALQEVEELVAIEPHNPLFHSVKAGLMKDYLTYPQHYDEETRQQPGDKRKLNFMKPYRNEKYGFGIEIPEDWSLSSGKLPPWMSLPLTLKLGWTPSVTVEFLGKSESFNINIEAMTPELPPDVTELLAIIQTQDMEYVNCEFGRIIVQDKTHTWVRYELKDKIWSKKYLIVIGGNGYAMTVACYEKKLYTQKEKVWDTIVSSFHLLAPIDDFIKALNQSTGAYRTVAQIRENLEMRVERRSRNLSYGKACDLIEENRFSDARFWLEKCINELSEDTVDTQVFILKKLVYVAKILGHKKDVLRYRKEIKRLDPTDYVNQVELVKLLAGIGN